MVRPLDIFISDPREKRRILEQEYGRRKRGDWGPWRELRVPPGAVGKDGWLVTITLAYKNEVFCVLWRDAPGGVIHLVITSASQIEPSWQEKQRIKNELVGVDKTAVEVFPPQKQVVDAADLYHLWVLPEGLKFGLSKEEDGQ